MISQRGVLKGIRIAYVSLAIGVPILGSLILPRWIGAIRCYENLIMIDHFINCPLAVEIGREAGHIDKNGKWDKEYFFDTFAKGFLHRYRCPSSGQEYEVTCARSPKRQHFATCVDSEP